MESESDKDLLKRVISREDARSFIDEIRLGMGGFTKETRDSYEKIAPGALYTIDNLKQLLIAATKILATDLYTKDTKFVYELIQNAEDNKYSIANDKQEIPWLEFRLFHDRIEIDSNEDGFTEKDIISICSTGKSTKAETKSSIGEKGIGFKSVFKIAQKVHVQSGLFSFAFEYNRKDDNSELGMVTPMNEDYLDLPAKVRTRITLHLLENLEPSAMKKDFLDLPDNLLLFLKQLKSLSIKIIHPGEQDLEISYLVTTTGKISSIEKTVGTTRSTQRFWITQGQAMNMPKDPARPGINEAEVVLAFPLDTSDCPVIDNQYVSAFLPLRRVGYKFLIQSDFITQASREDVLDSAWNRRLLDEIVVAFCYSVEEFLEHESLQYTWVRYLPKERIADDFWGKLREKLLLKIRSLDCIIDRSGGWALSPGAYRIVTDTYRGADDAPLLPDIIGESDATTRYLSDSYDPILDVPIIKCLGAVDLSPNDFLTRLEVDLRKPSALMRSSSTDEIWHSKVANILVSCLSLPDVVVREKIRMLQIVPLQSSRWVHSLHASIFFPTSGGIEVPPNLPLNLVHTDALQNSDRKRLFQKLGVREYEPRKIFPLIEQCQSGTTFQQSISYLRFIFWHHKEIPSPGLSFKLAPKPGDGKGWYNPRDKSKGWIYSSMPSDQEPHTMSYILESNPSELKGKLNFLWTEYHDAVAGEMRNNITGRQWLERYFELEHIPQLVSRYNKSLLSPEMLYIMEHKPQFLLRVLEYNWDYLISSPNKSKWISMLEKVRVSAGPFDRIALRSTFLPVPKLRDIAKRLDLAGIFPFIEELKEITDATAPKWYFTKDLGVGIEADLRFWTTLFLLSKGRSISDDKAVFEIYWHLYEFSFTEPASRKYEGVIRNLFQGESIYIPSTNSEGEQTSNWYTTEDCVWKGPEWFYFKIRLGDMEEYRRLSPLFQDILQIEDANLDSFLEYLGYIRDFDEDSTSDILGVDDDLVSNIYKEIQSKSLGRGHDIRTAFNDSQLIYHPRTQLWYSSKSCIWAEDNIQLPDKVSLASVYQNHKTFFISTLKIEEPNLEMHVAALEKRVLNRESKANIIMEMKSIAALSPEPQALKPLLSCKCLPVLLSSGQHEWQDPLQGVFAIVDRQEYGAAFKGKINVLDLSLEDVHSLGIFLSGLGLHTRYMSRTVREKTGASSGDLSETLSRQLNNKAYAICRYAAHYGSASISASPQAFLSLLQHAKVFTSDDINKSISINQGNQTITVKGDKAYVHLTQEGDQGGQLKIYVPRNKRLRQVCYMSHLPAALLGHFGAQYTSSFSGLGSILRASGNFEIIEFLQNAGIITLSGIETPDLEEDALSENENASENEDVDEAAIPGYAEINLQSRFTSSDTQDRPSLGDFTPVSSTVSLRSASLSTPGPGPEQDHFRRLIGAVIRQGQETAELPQRDHSMTIAFRGWDHTVDVSHAVYSPVPGEMEFRIGAAGELFVFERLTKLGLPGFSRQNWQSTIRHRVSVHQAYSDLDHWSGSETADIVYEDQQNVFTQHLIRKGYLRGHVWEGQTPTYYIEVKTTLSTCDTRFFCSQLQYDRMEEMRLSETVPSPRVYLVARVFNLRGPGIGLKLYVDPATLRDKGELRFRTDSTYHVTPSA